MTGTTASDEQIWRPEVFDAGLPEPSPALEDLLTDPGVAVLDERAAQQADLSRLRTDVPPGLSERPGCWVHYPWRRALVGVLGPEAFRLLRLDRNRNKITSGEQERLRELTVGVVGLSVGHSVAHTLALEGLCGRLRLADFDAVELSNLNRIPATVFDIGTNKAVVTARRVAELDPYLDVEVFSDGVTSENVADFLDGLDVLVEECDSLDLKIVLREEARRRGIPVLMETSDRGLLDVERFDLEPDRPVFHGLLGDIDSTALAALSSRDKVPHVLRILGAGDLSPRMAASMIEVGRSLTTWPQLGGDVALGGATIAAAVRRLGTGRHLPSGRIRVDLDEYVEGLGRSPEADPSHTVPVVPAPRDDDDPDGVGDAEHDEGTGGHHAVRAVLEAIRRAPSGGNVQPWRVETDDGGLRLYLDADRTSTMDVDHRGSYVALGAALFNARVAAAAEEALGPISIFPDAGRPDLVATLRFGDDTDDALSRRHPWLVERATNRSLGRPRPLPGPTVESLHDAASREGGRLHLLTPGERLDAAGRAMAAADRIRFLTSALHAEMFSELVWPDVLDDVGIETAMLGMDEGDLAKLTIAARPEVMALLADWDAGEALGEDTRDRIASSSALAVITVDGSEPVDFLRGGSAVEAVWLDAQAHGLAVQPMSPVFLFAVQPSDLSTLSERFASRLAEEQHSFRAAVGLAEEERVALVLRLGHTEVKAPRSRRRPVVSFRTAT